MFIILKQFHFISGFDKKKPKTKSDLQNLGDEVNILGTRVHVLSKPPVFACINQNNWCFDTQTCGICKTHILV